MKKVIRDNKVAVLLGDVNWKGYKDNSHIEWAFLPELVELLESEKWANIPGSYYKGAIQVQKVIDVLVSQGYMFTEQDLIDNQYYKEEAITSHTEYEISDPLFAGDTHLEGIYFCNVTESNLHIEWVNCNRKFAIKSCDSREYIIYQDEIDWLSVNNETN